MFLSHWNIMVHSPMTLWMKSEWKKNPCSSVCVAGLGPMYIRVSVFLLFLKAWPEIRCVCFRVWVDVHKSFSFLAHLKSITSVRVRERERERMIQWPIPGCRLRTYQCDFVAQMEHTSNCSRQKSLSLWYCQAPVFASPQTFWCSGFSNSALASHETGEIHGKIQQQIQQHLAPLNKPWACWFVTTTHAFLHQPSSNLGGGEDESPHSMTSWRVFPSLAQEEEEEEEEVEEEEEEVSKYFFQRKKLSPSLPQPTATLQISN